MREGRERAQRREEGGIKPKDLGRAEESKSGRKGGEVPMQV